jgi:hypothetical protein
MAAEVHLHVQYSQDQKPLFGSDSFGTEQEEVPAASACLRSAQDQQARRQIGTAPYSPVGRPDL